MRIISGIARGRILHGPKSDRIRPVLDKVKGAIFNILYDVTGQKVLDLFAGTGSAGLEALSRGAFSCVFIDRLPEALALLRKNIERCGFEASATVLRLEVPRELRRVQKFGPFDLVFVDPPYDKNLVNPALRVIAEENQLAPGGKVVVEHSPREAIDGKNGLRIVDRRKYGQTLITFLCQS